MDLLWLTMWTYRLIVANQSTFFPPVVDQPLWLLLPFYWCQSR